MRCPKCQFDHELQTTECLKCGIVFSRYQAAQEAAARKVELAAPAVQAHEPRYWYAARRYRWWGGRLPLTWEGWLVDAVWLVTWISLSPVVGEREHPLLFLGLVFGMLALFLAIREWKGEPERKYWDG
jgi:hypothetical protein